MSKPKKRQRLAKRDGTPEQRYNFIVHCERLIRARIKAGAYRDHPALEAAIAEFDPVIALIEIAADQNNTAETRAAVSAKLMPFWHKEQSLLVKEAGGGNVPVTISISVAPWASAKSSAPLPAPDEVIETIDVDAVRTNSSPPSPPMREQIRLQQIVAAAPTTQIFEVPSEPDRPKILVGETSQAKGFLTREQIMERLAKGRPHNEDRAQAENNQMLFSELPRDNRD